MVSRFARKLTLEILDFYGSATNHLDLGIWVGRSLGLFQNKSTQAQGDVARLLLMAPRDPWRNSTPDFGVVAYTTVVVLVED